MSDLHTSESFFFDKNKYTLVDGLDAMNFLAVKSSSTLPCESEKRGKQEAKIAEAFYSTCKQKTLEWRIVINKPSDRWKEKFKENRIKNYALMWHILISITLIRKPLND